MTSEYVASAPPGPSSQQGGRQRLNAADCTMLCIDRVLRSMGCPGFETQVLLWLSARVDVGRLETALARLGERYPVVAAHLVEAGDRGSPCWGFRPGDRCRWQETDLGAGEPETVLQH